MARRKTISELEQREVEEMACDLKRAGLRLREIADRVSEQMRIRLAERGDERAETWSITAESARHAIRRALARATERANESAADLRDFELQRLDEMQFGLWNKARRGDTAAVRAVLQIMDRRRELTGIDKLGGLGEEGAEVRFGVMTPADIAARKKSMQAHRDVVQPLPSFEPAPNAPTQPEQDASEQPQERAGPTPEEIVAAVAAAEHT